MNFNLLVIAGRLCGDPELKKTKSDLPVTTFTVAVNRPTKDKSADFIPVVAWRGTAEFISKWFHKGDPIMLTGNIQSRKWQDKDGRNHTAIEMIAERADFVGGKAEPEEGVRFEEVYDNIELPF